MAALIAREGPFRVGCGRPCATAVGQFEQFGEPIRMFVCEA